MKNRYDEAMKNIVVTNEMRDRILNNISKLDLQKTSKKTLPFPQFKKYLSIAACFAVLIVGSVIVHNTINLPSEPPVQIVPEIVSYHSNAELSDAIGFMVKEIQELPFEIESVKYTSYWGELADIEYAGSDNTAIFRMASGVEDVSGYYGEFTSVESHVINGYDVTIKGNDGQYLLAVWQNDGYSYSVQFIEPVSQQEMFDTIQSIK
ncbi:hypothetical protein [Lacrimispora sp.]|uniref:hypothetical protein n=1 Tax=Lacrimispora sp. TaxID=2719234 RepID=UPI002860CD57|nr:hypothetical protein [Lacrimispora sp.]MDR7810409.1 hypothetical protein [Lacrimispora sp.]